MHNMTRMLHYYIALLFPLCLFFFFFNDTATTEIYTLSLHDALPISVRASLERDHPAVRRGSGRLLAADEVRRSDEPRAGPHQLPEPGGVRAVPRAAREGRRQPRQHPPRRGERLHPRRGPRLPRARLARHRRYHALAHQLDRPHGRRVVHARFLGLQEEVADAP